MSVDPRQGLERLRALAYSGELDALCQRWGIALLSVFGSTTRSEGELASELAPSVGLRNVLIRQYVALDPSIVIQSVPLALVCYRQYLAAVAAFLLRRRTLPLT